MVRRACDGRRFVRVAQPAAAAYLDNVVAGSGQRNHDVVSLDVHETNAGLRIHLAARRLVLLLVNLWMVLEATPAVVVLIVSVPRLKSH